MQRIQSIVVAKISGSGPRLQLAEPAEGVNKVVRIPLFALGNVGLHHSDFFLAQVFVFVREVVAVGSDIRLDLGKLVSHNRSVPGG